MAAEFAFAAGQAGVNPADGKTAKLNSANALNNKKNKDKQS